MGEIFTRPVTQEIGSAGDKKVTGTSVGDRQALDVSLASIASTASLPLYIIQIDTTTTANAVYYGWAVPGSTTASASWKILKETVSSGDSSFLFAGSDSLFDKVWNDRASLSYG